MEMQKAIIGKKIGMTQIFDESGRVVPVTLIQAGPCTVVQKKTAEKDGYEAIQLGFENAKEKHLTKPEIGHQKKAGIEELKRTLEVCKNTHAELGDKTHGLLLSMNADTKPPHPVARFMSDVKVRMKVMEGGDDKIADVMTDGCDMGIKSLHRYLNQYKNADREAKNIAERLIASEEYLESKIRSFL